jgi:Ca-activated chloride channel family protein
MHFSTHLDVDLVALEAEDQVTLMLELAAPVAAGDAVRPPATVMVVLDRSGSMAGERLEVAKAAIDALVGRLAPTDRLGVVAFDDEVGVVVPCGPLAGMGPAARQAIAALGPGGMTNLSGGLLRGLQELRRAAGDDGGTLVLLSDGHANVGEVDPDRLGGVCAKARGRRVTTSTIGVGLDYDEALLSALARGGAGSAHFAEEADTAGAQLAGEVDGLLRVTAQAASLMVRPAAGVEGVTVWNDIPGVGTPDGIMLELGDLAGGEERRLVLTLDVPAVSSLGLAKVADLRLTWVALPELVEHTIDAPVHVNVVPGDEAAGRIADPTVTSELAFQKAQRTKRDAARALRDGRVAEASDLYRDAGLGLRGAAASAPVPTAHELHHEADLLEDLALRAATDDVRRVAKQAEADSARKSRKRGRG